VFSVLKFGDLVQSKYNSDFKLLENIAKCVKSVHTVESEG